MSDKKFPQTIEERLAEINEDREILVGELAKMAIDSDKRTSGGWSVADIIYHLHLTEGLLTGLVTGLLNGPRGNQADEATLEQEWKLVRAAVARRREMKIEAPEPIVPKNTPSLAEGLELLKKSRAGLIAALAGVSTADLASVKAPHIAREIGEISGLGWISLMGAHELRHLDQIKELQEV
jgi:DinB superfamily